ncbi:MAG: hypothetical protein J6B95_04700 [Oscillospiraceae bacterium]|nr:hypothetical protein [Oscillospiraceae bacterium]
MKKQLLGLGFILFGILLVLADLNGMVKIPILGDIMSVNSIGLLCGIAGLGIIVYYAFKKDRT